MGEFTILGAISNRLANIIIDCNAGKPEYHEWYTYYIEQKISQFLTYSLLLLISLFSGRMIEAIIFLFYWQVLRSATGGYHANSRVSCFFISTGIFILGVFGMPDLIDKFPYFVWVMFIATISVVIICAPVIHPNLYQESHHKKKMRLLSLLVLGGEYAFIGIGLLFSINNSYIIAACNAMFLASILLLVAKILKQESQMVFEKEKEDERHD